MTARTTRSALIRVLLRFPTTAILLGPYALVLLPLAIWNDNPRTDFIIATGALAAGGAFLVEASVAAIALAERTRRPHSGRPRTAGVRTVWSGDRVAVIGRIVAMVSIVANTGAPLLGANTLRSQVAGQVAGGLAGALTPFNSWGAAALALLVAAYFLGGVTKREVLAWIAALLAVQMVVAYVSNITVRLGSMAVLVVVVLLMTRLVRPGLVLTGVMGLIVAWPTVFAIRNRLRETNGIAVDRSATAANDRLRFDEQIVRAADYGPVHDLGQPDFWGALRYGLVPRLLDPDRPALSSGNAINEFLGGTSTSSYTFLPIATTWFFWGSLAVVLIYAAWAVAVVSLRPWHMLERRPVALMLFVLAIGGPLSMLATPPDSLMALLQTLVSLVPVILLLQFWARRPVRAATDGVPERSAAATPMRAIR